MNEEERICPCGRQLHYDNPSLEAVVDMLIAELGPAMPVTANGRTWMVPRHYIALDGTAAWHSKGPGFPEVFRCPKCGTVSHHPDDLKNRYCGHCHEFQ